MARDNTEAAQQRHVHFDPNVLRKHAPKAGKLPPSEVRRKSLDPNDFVGPDFQGAASHTVGQDDDDDEPEDLDLSNLAPEELYKYYLEHVQPIARRAHYFLNKEVPTRDLKERLHSLLDHMHRNGDAFMPFTPMTSEGKSDAKAKSFDGPMTYDQFIALVQTSPEVMFMEMRVRTASLIGAIEQSDDLTDMLNRADKDLQILENWADRFGSVAAGLSGKVAHGDPDPPGSDTNFHTSNAGFQQALAENQRLKKENKHLLASLKTALNAAGKATSGGGDPDDSDKDSNKSVASKGSRNGPPPNPPRNNRSRSGTPATTTTSTAHSGDNKRSAKEESAGKFYNDDKEDKVTFDVWYYQIKTKFEVNADHFGNDRQKFGHITNRLAGKAAQALLPYLDSDHPDRLTTSDDLLKYLWEEYHDHSAYEKALAEFNDLEMKYGERFQIFKNTFQRLAGQCRRPRDQWKSDLRRKITKELRQAAESTYLDPSKQFTDYVLLLNSLDEGNRMDAQKSRQRDGKQGFRRNAASKDSAPAPKAAVKTPAFERPTPEEMRELAREGRCFSCYKKGHMSSECPHKEKLAKRLDAHLNSIADAIWGKDSSNVKELLDAPSSDDESTPSDDEDASGSVEGN